MSLQYNLQFFAKDGPGGEKTEEPTQKKLDDARKDGSVAKSKELMNGISLLALFLIIKFWAGTMGTQMLGIFSFSYTKMSEFSTISNGEVSTADFAGLLQEIIIDFLIIILPIIAIAFILSIVVDLAQVKWKPTTKPLQPKLSKLNPIKGFKRMFSAKSLVELVKSIAKILLVGYIVYSSIDDIIADLFFLYDMSLKQAIGWLGQTVTTLGLKISGAYMIIAAVDYIYEKRKFHQDMRMTKQELKDEYRNSEGDPQVKGKIKRKMLEVSQRRMMQALPQADVVITNPTHLSVAIKYDAKVSDAPLVIAKGEDYLALKIREVAKANNIQIVENKPLARMLYHNVEVGGAIPPELYQAVAEILAAVYHAQGKV